ncbi:Putative zinc-finger [Actinokineospora alba]|uniref:Putative zinc-finger n=1 Tax=Actinokineospora alba TaxID=504798 RepID=A0A1H0I3F0_9PSEU|nr:zf-HC2 domain-containing protein [Actinokineospora alba]TDP64624.1 putative zinc finger protein [Actinokineospora alba]SDI85720.1 Putative zinc-finger [Actinokineospora alba]SDO25923.1 Putative zinc-finger [Actinokineospora alba]
MLLTSVGAYVLGALDPADRAEFEAHLAGCASCKAELLRMAPLPGLLHRITPEDYEDQPDLPEPEPVPLAEPIPLRRKRGPRRQWPLAAAVVIVVALGAGTAVLAQNQREPEPTAVSWSAKDTASGVGAEVALTGHAWGTEVRITLRDVPAGKPCKLVVRDRDGGRQVAGWWSTTFEPGETIPGSTSFDLARIARVEVVTDDDKVLVTVPAPA